MDYEQVLSCPYTAIYDVETINMLEKEFSRLKDECYVDHAGATLYSDTQINESTNNLKQFLYANPHSAGSTSSNVTHDSIERMRYKILKHFNTSIDDYSVIFTSGATDSLKTIAESFNFSNKNDSHCSKESAYFIYTQDNHTSVLGMRDIINNKDVNVLCLPHDEAFDLFKNHSESLVFDEEEHSCSLFVYPAQCNFSGLKYPLSWIKNVQRGALCNLTNKTNTKWYVVLDAACYVSTNELDLSIHKPDFVCLSFYKMFGYPTGIGALLVKNTSSDVLSKNYYGGGTVEIALSLKNFHIKRKILHQRFEDGTLPFISIISLQHGLDILSRISMRKISKHVFSLARILHHNLLLLHHSNKTPVIEIYSDTDYESNDLQGGIVTFNIKRSSGEYVGYTEVLNMAAIFKIHLRTGCFCNPGACQRHLSLSDAEILQNYEAGYVCGGTADLINGKPTGAIRVSFGYMSTINDVYKILTMVKKCFVDGSDIVNVPEWWYAYKESLHKKYSPHIKKYENNNIMEITNGINNNMKLIEISNENFIDENKFHFNNKRIKLILENLYVYPIKSCAAYEVKKSWPLSSSGLKYDREWMIITSSGACLTQKHNTKLCLVKPTIHLSDKIMTITYPGMPQIDISLEYPTNKIKIDSIHQSRVCGNKVEGVDCGAEISEWFSLALGIPNLRLIRKNQECSEGLSFSSQAQYLLINKASVSWLLEKITNPDFESRSFIQRFRGNIMINGYSAFEELNWKIMTIASNTFMVKGPCTRCQMICIDQTTGEKNVEPLRTLAEQFHGKLKFGIYLTCEKITSGFLNIGDTIYID